jgi:hypothetical protein
MSIKKIGIMNALHDCDYTLNNNLMHNISCNLKCRSKIGTFISAFIFLHFSYNSDTRPNTCTFLE